LVGEQHHGAGREYEGEHGREQAMEGCVRHIGCSIRRRSQVDDCVGSRSSG
jgi:hypothetical protein